MAEPAPQTPDREPAIALVTEPGGPLALTSDPKKLSARLAAYSVTRKVLLDWIFANLVAGIDYMVIHRKVYGQECPKAKDKKTSPCPCGAKATLMKPGAEKIDGLLQVQPRFRRDEEIWTMFGSEPGMLCLLCELVDQGGVVVAEGRGCRRAGQDSGDVNRCVKMCQKSAQIDATLRYGGLSEIFTQDLDDTPPDERRGGGFGPAPRKSPPTQNEPSNAEDEDLAAKLRESIDREEKKDREPGSGDTIRLITNEQRVKLMAAARAAGIDVKKDRTDALHRALAKKGLVSMKDIPAEIFEAVLAWVEQHGKGRR